MNLIDLKNHVSGFPEGTMFKYSLSEPFSWRGSYNEVAFDIIEKESSREAVLAMINLAYNKIFYGYKGGQYSYSDHTPVNFETNYGSWTDGGYAEEWIAKIEGTEIYNGPEDRLTKLLFN